MDKIGVMPKYGLGGKSKKRAAMLIVIQAVISFLLGKVVLFGAVSPFGLAFLAACVASDNSLSARYAVITAFGIAGAALSGADIFIIRYMLAYVMFGLIYISVSTLSEDRKPFPVSGEAAIAMFLSGIIFFAQKGFELYSLIMLLTESILCGVSAYIMQNAVPLLTLKARIKVLLPIEIAGMAVIAPLCILGVSDIMLGSFSFGSACAAMLIMICAACGGAMGGVAGGAIIGLIFGLTRYPMTEVVGVFSLCGLTAGLARRFSRAGIILAFFIANIVLSFYSGGTGGGVFSMLELFAAIAIFLCMPAKIIDEGSELMGTASKPKSSDTVKYAAQKLRDAGLSFALLAKTFAESIKPSQTDNMEDITTLFDKTADKVCKRCTLKFVCWEKQFNTTYDCMMKLVPALTERGAVKTSDIGQPFRSRCIKSEEFISELNKIYTKYKLDMQQQQKSIESKELAKEQFAGISKIIDSLAEEIGEGAQCDLRLGGSIALELENAGFKKCNVSVIKNRLSRFEVSISMKRCVKKEECIEKISSIVSAAIKREMSVTTVSCAAEDNTKRCTMILSEKEIFSVCCGAASKTKSGQTQSGDNYNYTPISDGKYVLVLSDGMGSGAKAASTSKATVAMLRQLLSAGFDKQSTIKIINSALLLGTSDECFATIDITILDLFGGDAEFIKIGANSTFIKRGKKVYQINSTTLPVGILNEVDIESTLKRVENDDYIIMISDGVQAAEGDWLKKFLSTIEDMPPNEMADTIIRRAGERQNGCINDDMTVLAAKLVSV